MHQKNYSSNAEIFKIENNKKMSFQVEDRGI